MTRIYGPDGIVSKLKVFHEEFLKIALEYPRGENPRKPDDFRTVSAPRRGESNSMMGQCNAMRCECSPQIPRVAAREGSPVRHLFSYSAVASTQDHGNTCHAASPFVLLYHAPHGLQHPPPLEDIDDCIEHLSTPRARSADPATSPRPARHRSSPRRRPGPSSMESTSPPWWASATARSAVSLRVADYYTQGRRSFFRLHEKGGRYNVVPVHYTAQAYVDAYIGAARLGEDRRGSLFRSCEPGRCDALQGGDVAGRRIQDVQVPRPKGRTTVGICAHSFRGTGITEYLRNGGDLDVATRVEGHESSRTTQLYNRLREESRSTSSSGSTSERIGGL